MKNKVSVVACSARVALHKSMLRARLSPFDQHSMMFNARPARLVSL
jgi:hypothetical protein